MKIISNIGFNETISNLITNILNLISQMDVGRSGPGPLDGSLLTLQSVHRSQVVWDNIEVNSFFSALFFTFV